MLASRFVDSLRFLLLAMLAGLALIAVAGTAVTGLPRGGLGNQYPSDPSDVRGVRPHFAFRDDWVVQPDFDLGSRPLKPCWSLGKLTWDLRSPGTNCFASLSGFSHCPERCQGSHPGVAAHMHTGKWPCTTDSALTHTGYHGAGYGM